MFLESIRLNIVSKTQFLSFIKSLPKVSQHVRYGWNQYRVFIRSQHFVTSQLPIGCDESCKMRQRQAEEGEEIGEVTASLAEPANSKCFLGSVSQMEMWNKSNGFGNTFCVACQVGHHGSLQLGSIWRLNCVYMSNAYQSLSNCVTRWH